jgi:hypothetical protein
MEATGSVVGGRVVEEEVIAVELVPSSAEVNYEVILWGVKCVVIDAALRLKSCFVGFYNGLVDWIYLVDCAKAA